MKYPDWFYLIKKIAPLNRALVSPGIDEGFSILEKNYEISLLEFETGDFLNGWEVPPSWIVNEAKITHVDTGKVILNFENESPLSLFTYSPSFNGIFVLKELKRHILTDPEMPDDYVFHFRNGYNFKNPIWGFTMPYNRFKNLEKGKYEIKINTEFKPSKMKMALSTKE